MPMAILEVWEKPVRMEERCPLIREVLVPLTWRVLISVLVVVMPVTALTLILLEAKGVTLLEWLWMVLFDFVV